VSTFRLEPEHYLSQLARSTCCQRPNRPGPPERRAFSPCELTAIDRNSHVLETFQNYRFYRRTVNPLQSQDFHLFCTRGATIQTGTGTGVENSYDAQQKRCFRETKAHFRHAPRRKTVESSKIAWEVLLFAKPFRDIVPECGLRDPELIWRL